MQRDFRHGLLMPSVDHTLEMAVDPGRVVAAFFDPAALATWWQVERSVTTPRVLGVYAVQWPTTPFADERFGPLGGVLYGTVMDYRAEREFLVAEVHWLPPASEVVGPMALHVSCTPALQSRTTRVRILQTGGDDSARCKRYYEIMASSWTASMAALKDLLEQGR